MNDEHEPKKFLNLHSHTDIGSIGDAIGNPKDHIDFALSNGMDGIALTEHGNLNSFSHQYFYWKELKSKGLYVKAPIGIEVYLIPSLKEWRELYQQRQEEKKHKKQNKQKQQQSQNQQQQYVGDSYDAVKEHLNEMHEDTPVVDDDDKDDQGGTIIENEEESKFKKQDPINRRNHLVLLAKNYTGLMALYKLVSYSFIEGFYKFPRVDFDMIRKYANGNLIGLSGCVAGRLSQIVFDNQTETDWNQYEPNNVNFEKIQADLKEEASKFQEALGEGNFFLEIQFNDLKPQHLVNQHLIELSKRSNIPLVATADAHYANPDHWREREIYKAMAWLQKGGNAQKLQQSIPQTIDELHCELYPKNAKEMWKAYKGSIQGRESDWTFYEDEMIKNAIERSYDIAHDFLDEAEPDTRVKLPGLSKIVENDKLERVLNKLGEDYVENLNETQEEKVAFKALLEKAKEGAKWRGVDKDQEYIDRLKYELEVVKYHKFSKYFLAYQQIMKIIGKELLTGNARGSAGASLLAFVLNITQMDPIKYGLVYERFMSYKKHGMPDIDSDCSDRERAIELLKDHFGEYNVIPISNFNQLQLRSLIKDVCRLNGFSFEEINQYTKKIENEARSEAKKQPGFDAQQWVLTYEEAEEKSPTFNKLMKKYPDLERSIKTLFKQVRNCISDDVKVLTTDGYKSIEDIGLEDGIFYIDHVGQKQINYNYTLLVQGVKDFYIIELEDGTEIELTEDHEVMTNNGYKMVKDLQKSDKLVPFEYG